MKTVEENLAQSLHRVDVIEKKLQTRLLTNENREKLERELEDVKDILKTNEKQLQSLRMDNTKSFVVAGCLAFVCFLIFGLYSMIYNNY